jgi:hypothetical protein
MRFQRWSYQEHEELLQQVLTLCNRLINDMDYFRSFPRSDIYKMMDMSMILTSKMILYFDTVDDIMIIERKLYMFWRFFQMVEPEPIETHLLDCSVCFNTLLCGQYCECSFMMCHACRVQLILCPQCRAQL